VPNNIVRGGQGGVSSQSHPLSQIYLHVVLKEYIRNLDQHHRKETFQDELRRLFRKYGIEFDERYVWH
jgi:hypothetical protein